MKDKILVWREKTKHQQVKIYERLKKWVAKEKDPTKLQFAKLTLERYRIKLHYD